MPCRAYVHQVVGEVFLFINYLGDVAGVSVSARLRGLQGNLRAFGAELSGLEARALGLSHPAVGGA